MGWGSSTRRGGGRKLRARPRNFVFLGFRREESGMSREFCRDVPDPWRCSKSLCTKKLRAQFSFPKVWGLRISRQMPNGQNVGQALKLSENKHFGADIHDLQNPYKTPPKNHLQNPYKTPTKPQKSPTKPPKTPTKPLQPPPPLQVASIEM